MGWSAMRPGKRHPRAARRRVALAAFALLATVPFAAAKARAQSGDSLSLPVLPPIPIQSADWETLATSSDEALLRPLYNFRYNRVDGPALTAGLAVRMERAPAPLVYAQATYAFSRERLLLEGGLEAPLGDPVHVRLGGAAYRRTATEDAWIVDEVENTIFALLARTDYRDYYESEGFEVRAIWQPGLDFALRGDVRVEDQRSLPNEANVSLTGGNDRFRENPPIEEGQDGVLSGTVRVGPDRITSDGGTRGTLTYERAGDPVHGDFEYGRVRGQVTTRIRPGKKQDARARLVGGSTLTGSLPSQKAWHLGGISTLRGEDFKTFSGDQFLLANAEYYLLARKNVWAFGFLDWGMAWFGKDNLSRQQFALDGGIGVRIAEGPLAVTAARNLQRSDAAIRVGVRLGGTF
jgi:hypothetical protein